MIIEYIKCPHCEVTHESVEAYKNNFANGNGFHITFTCINCGRKSHIKKELLNADSVTVKPTIMGAINKSAAITFLTITDGRICRRVSAPTATSVERVNKVGNTVHEEYYSGWEGTITSITTKDTDYGKNWEITLTDGDGTAVLSMGYSSGYSAAFLKTLPNIDLSKPVTLSPKLQTIGDKKKATMFVNQGGAALKWYYTKDNRNGLPELKKLKVKGKETWDDSDMMEFLEKMVAEKFSEEAPF